MPNENPNQNEAKEKKVLLPHVVTRVFSSTEQGEKDAADFVRKELEKRYPSMDDFEREGLFQGFKEIFSNALYHGNLGLKGQVGSYIGTDSPIPWNEKSIVVTLKLSSKQFSVSVQDEGKGFKVDKVRAGIAAVTGEDVLSAHHRGLVFIRQWQYGSPAKVEFVKDEKGNIHGTRVTLTRDFNVELPILDDVTDYIVEA